MMDKGIGHHTLTERPVGVRGGSDVKQIAWGRM